MFCDFQPFLIALAHSPFRIIKIFYQMYFRIFSVPQNIPFSARDIKILSLVHPLLNPYGFTNT